MQPNGGSLEYPPLLPQAGGVMVLLGVGVAPGVGYEQFQPGAHVGVGVGVWVGVRLMGPGPGPGVAGIMSAEAAGSVGLTMPSHAESDTARKPNTTNVFMVQLLAVT